MKFFYGNLFDVSTFLRVTISSVDVKIDLI